MNERKAFCHGTAWPACPLCHPLADKVNDLPLLTRSRPLNRTALRQLKTLLDLQRTAAFAKKIAIARLTVARRQSPNAMADSSSVANTLRISCRDGVGGLVHQCSEH